jgi:acetyl-CoA carboxylase carboxyl transferase beta subunit
MDREELFPEVCSVDFLSFKFGSRGYQDQLNDSITKTNALAGVKVELVSLRDSNGAVNKAVWVTHNFAFLGGSLGCAEGEKITRAFEYSTQNKLPIIVQCRTGGARMQEGTSSLMQMAKVSVAVDAHKQSRLPYISVLSDPTYGGVSASYAMQADIRIATGDARIGFAGPEVILNTMCGGVQAKYDTDCPSDFQSAQFVMDHGQIDMVIDTSKGNAQATIEETVGNIVGLFSNSTAAPAIDTTESQIGEADKTMPFDYTRARSMDRPQTQDIIQQLFQNFIELSGDGCVGRDRCIRGGIGSFQGRSCVVFGSYKGHTHQTYEDANYGMASPCIF